MNSSDGGSSNPAKKRKGNEGNAIVSGRSGGFLSSWFGYFSGRDAAPSTKSNDVNINTSSQLDRMEQIMMRMEDKQNMLEAKCSSLESALEAKCSSIENTLEAKCSSLQSALDIKLQSLKGQVDKLEDNVNSLHVHAQQNNEYNQMVLTNLGWSYSAAVLTYNVWLSRGYDDDEARYLEVTAALLKKMTIAMRRGIFPECDMSDKCISLCPEGRSVSTHSNDELSPHWDEFTTALNQFTPAIKMVPDDLDSSFHLVDFPMDQKIMTMIREALIEKPFTHMCFEHNADVDYEYGGMNIDSIIRIAENNKSLRKLEIHYNSIGSHHIEALCSIALNYPLLELSLNNSMDVDDGVGDTMLTSLLSNRELKLEKLSMECTSITSEVSALLADFIATNPKLEELNLQDNMLNDNDAALMANALHNNTTLRRLYLFGNDITIEGSAFAFVPVLYDTSSLNAIVTSNHSCDVSLLDINTYDKIEDNRGSKIYFLLSVRHAEENSSNTQYFSDIDVKLLPNMIEAIQKYGEITNMSLSRVLSVTPEKRIKSVSIVYEVMRKWDKIFNFYESV